MWWVDLIIITSAGCGSFVITAIGLFVLLVALHWRHRERHGVSNHRRIDCLFNRLLRRRQKKSKFRVTGLCEGNSRVTGEIHALRASNAENVSIWWRHHIVFVCYQKVELTEFHQICLTSQSPKRRSRRLHFICRFLISSVHRRLFSINFSVMI